VTNTNGNVPQLSGNCTYIVGGTNVVSYAARKQLLPLLSHIVISYGGVPVIKGNVM
jgi:hypothetical protein